MLVENQKCRLNTAEMTASSMGTYDLKNFIDALFFKEPLFSRGE